MSKVFVLDTNKQVLTPVHPGRARVLLSSGKAAVFKRYPFTLILKRAVEQLVVEPLRLKIDPGSKVTGLAIVNDASGEVVFAAELTHRGQTIRTSLERRRMVRRSRRQRHTRYRKPRFDNRRNKQKGWIAPSLESRIANVITWVKRLMRVCPLTAISQERVRFDLQQMENPEIAGVEYQQGTLQGYEVREYLLEKWHRTCAYCGAKDVPLHVEHINPRSQSHDNRICNLCIACEPCNAKKGTQDIRVFLKEKAEVLKRLLAQAKAPLKDAAAMNATRRALYTRLKEVGLPVECGSGGLTKFNRTVRGLEKDHWLDAACVGKSTPAHLHVKGIVPLLIKANGHGCRQMCLMDKYGFPRTKPKQKKFKHGFRTGDIVKAVVPSHLKNAGTYTGRMAAKASGAFTIATSKGHVTDIRYTYCRMLQRADGYSYQQKGAEAFPPIA
ncbi:MAG: RNA-guided endonuclease IscB [Chloroflexota bacterium]|nr:RNA-guided endonuclease IscB [Chloroflexota bacterium]